ncbi:MAG TPA: S53 family peptidase [Candidatus Bathyarchaeia archaeon]|nr:S53 family peptidase [Candidatus Bathyarchaeia archaeon]
MKRQHATSVAFLACLMLFALVMPFAGATSVTKDLVALFDSRVICYHASLVTVNPASYASGFLYNTVTELQRAYGLDPLYAAGYNGAGQTVVIVDAFGSPTIYSDLLSFIQWQNQYAGANLPWTTLSAVESHLRIYYPQGKPVFNASNSDELGWSLEVTLDVDMVHAIAPGANIALVIAPNDNFGPLDYAVNYAIFNHLGCAISQSWGAPEYELTGPSGIAVMLEGNSIYMSAAQAQITVFASAGDIGAANFGPYDNPSFPASDPYVTAVGGTNLFMHCTNGYNEGAGEWNNGSYTGLSYFYEIAGNDYEAMVADGYPSPFDIVTTGGAMSSFFTLPYWQQGIALTYTNGTTVRATRRCVSDVSFDSGVYGGLGAVPWSVQTPGSPIFYIIGGTSAGSPFWSALTAIAGQYAGHRLGFINPSLYGLYFSGTAYLSGAFHDITKGDNTYPTGYNVTGYEATRGWDAPTGIGSPNAAYLVPLMKGW